MGRITKEEALQILKQAGLSKEVLDHVKGVTHRAEVTCRILKNAGHQLDEKKVGIAALLHDVGYQGSRGLDYGRESARILHERGFDDIARLLETVALPRTAKLPLEAKVLIYADTTTDSKGEPIDPMKKLKFLQRLAREWEDPAERNLAKEAYEVKRRVVSEVDELVKIAMAKS